MKPPVFDASWPEDVQALYQHDVQEIWDNSLMPHIWRAYHNQLAIYESFAAGGAKRILDVGCAQGTLALRLAEKGHRVTAVDIRAQFLDYAKSRYTHGDIEFLALNALEEPIPGEYDLIFANQIVEHVVYPDQLCRSLARSLAPGGRLVMTTPNWRYLMSRLPSYAELGDPSAWEHLQHSADGDGHFFAFTSEELSASFRAAGLTDVRCFPFETPFVSGHMKFRFLQRFMPDIALRSLERVASHLPLVGSRLCHQLLCTGVASERRS